MLCEPTTPPPPTTYPGVLGKFPGCSELPGTFGEVPGVFGNFRVFLESSGCFWEVPGVFGKFPGFVWEVPARFRKFPGVLEVAEFWDPKNTFCDPSFAKKTDPKQKLVISDRCSMLNLREFEVGAPNPKQAT